MSSESPLIAHSTVTARLESMVDALVGRGMSLVVGDGSSHPSPTSPLARIKARLSSVSGRSGVMIGAAAAVAWWWGRRRAVAQRIMKQKASSSILNGRASSLISDSTSSSTITRKVGVDARFLTQFRFLLRICIPKWRCKTTGIVILHTCFLILRTYLSVIVARLDGRLVKDLVRADFKEFSVGLTYWFLISIPATYTNSMIKYLQSKLAINLRTSLTTHVHKIYMENNTYYKAVYLDNRIDRADQLITTDINRFCNALASLYSNLGKPLLDMIIFNYQLATSIGFSGMWGLLINYFITASVLKAVTPAFGRMAAQEAKLEGDFRSAHSRLITNAEEIAFYNGEQLEKSILNRTYSALIKHINSIYRIRIGYNMFEDFIIKYSWSAVGLMIASIPVFHPEWAGSKTRLENAQTPENQTGSRTKGFITNKRLMMSLADAGGRIMYSYKELSELAGYTYRVNTLIETLTELHSQKMIAGDQASMQHNFNGIEFESVAVSTPKGDVVLIKDLSFKIEAGDHLMITGPNGAGKTSILRVIAGLWPLFHGSIRLPTPTLDSIIYIPQRPYLAIGSLREQIIYPHSVDDMKAAGKTDQDLAAILKLVYLEYIPTREGGFGAVKEWKDVFSGGEKQRMQLARVFYHKPSFAVLDEATSAVSNDVEALLYAQAEELGITIITISHRPSLFKYHKYLLRIGEGEDNASWLWSKIGSSESLMSTMDQEIVKLSTQIKSMDQLKKRLAVIDQELNLVR